VDEKTLVNFIIDIKKYTCCY